MKKHCAVINAVEVQVSAGICTVLPTRGFPGLTLRNGQAVYVFGEEIQDEPFDPEETLGFWSVSLVLSDGDRFLQLSIMDKRDQEMHKRWRFRITRDGFVRIGPRNRGRYVKQPALAA